MKVGVPRETAPTSAEWRWSPTSSDGSSRPASEVLVERGAGVAAGYLDDAYTEAGARVVDATEIDAQADVVVRVTKPSAAEIARLRDGDVLIAFLQPLDRPGDDAPARRRGVVAFAMESIPRITRAQSMDALSSQATVSGYKAALIAADHLPHFFPMLMTAAGTVPPAKVLVLGAGVAGLQAIATARPARRRRLRVRRSARRARAGRVRSARRSSTSASSARRPRAATRVS